jgi:hypothetical protein
VRSEKEGAGQVLRFVQDEEVFVQVPLLTSYFLPLTSYLSPLTSHLSLLAAYAFLFPPTLSRSARASSLNARRVAEISSSRRRYQRQ